MKHHHLSIFTICLSLYHIISIIHYLHYIIIISIISIIFIIVYPCSSENQPIQRRLNQEPLVQKDRADGASSLLGGAAKIHGTMGLTWAIYGEHIGNIMGNIEDNIGRYGNRTCQEYIFRFYQQKWFADWYETIEPGFKHQIWGIRWVTNHDLDGGFRISITGLV